MIVHITRHGQPWLPEPGETSIAFPREDPPLTPLGRAQARRLGERLKAMGFAGVIYASPYRRTAETANIIAETLGTSFRPEPAIREIVKDPAKMVGFRGLTLAELAQEFPHLAPDAHLIYPWWTDEAETPDMVLERVRPFLERLAAQADGDVLLVGHGASTGACVRYYLAAYPELLATRGPNWNCALTSIRIWPRLEALAIADVSHLAPEQVTTNRVTLAMWREETAHLEFSIVRGLDATWT